MSNDQQIRPIVKPIEETSARPAEVVVVLAKTAKIEVTLEDRDEETGE